jgi:hypothetical protein
MDQNELTEITHKEDTRAKDQQWSLRDDERATWGYAMLTIRTTDVYVPIEHQDDRARFDFTLEFYASFNELASLKHSS